MIGPKRFVKSLRHAVHGLVEVARTEHSFRVQLFAAVIMITAAIALSLATWERILLFLIIAAVLVLEIMNSILERLADALQPRLSMMVKEVKDMMAGAVLIAAITSAVVGWFIFWPHLRTFFIQVWAMVY